MNALFWGCVDLVGEVRDCSHGVMPGDAVDLASTWSPVVLCPECVWRVRGKPAPRGRLRRNLLDYAPCCDRTDVFDASMAAVSEFESRPTVPGFAGMRSD